MSKQKVLHMKIPQENDLRPRCRHCGDPVIFQLMQQNVLNGEGAQVAQVIMTVCSSCRRVYDTRAILPIDLPRGEMPKERRTEAGLIVPVNS